MNIMKADIHFGGKWDEAENYVDYKINEIFLYQNTTFQALIGKMKRKVDFNIETHIVLMELSTKINVNKYIEIKSDNDVSFLECFLSNEEKGSAAIVIDNKKLVEPSPSELVLVPSQPLELDYLMHDEPNNSFMDDIPDGFEYINFVNVDCPAQSFYLRTSNAMYASKAVLKKALQVIALKQNFKFKTEKSNTCRLFVCCKEFECSWFVRASRYKESDGWIIKKHCLQHSCSVDIIRSDHPQAGSSIIAEYIKDFFRVGAGTFMTPIDIQYFMQSKHGISIKYMKAWRAREIFLSEIRGNPEESYALIPKFCHVINQNNDGSYVKFELAEENRFKYLFMSLGASIAGFASCRPVISVDGTFLKAKYRGTLMTACALDGNNQVFPIAVAVVDSENDNSWVWFFTHLRNIIGETKNLVIISDRHPSIYKAVCVVMPGVHYGVCMQHLSQNIKTKFRKKNLADLFKRSAQAYTKEEYEIFWNQMNGMDPKVIPYLNDIQQRTWSLAHFPGIRFNVMTTNICESYNAALSCARELPVVSALEEIRFKLEKWFYERRTIASCVRSNLTPWAETILRRNIQIGRKMTVRQLNEHEYVVVTYDMEYRLNLDRQMCVCRRWNMMKIPCSHACAAIISKNLPPSNYVHKYYMTKTLLDTYSGMIQPIGNKKQWKVPESISSIVVLPPDVRRPAGRPKKKRYLSALESSQSGSKKCSRCQGSGHNRKSCRNPIRAKNISSE